MRVLLLISVCLYSCSMNKDCIQACKDGLILRDTAYVTQMDTTVIPTIRLDTIIELSECQDTTIVLQDSLIKTTVVFKDRVLYIQTDNEGKDTIIRKEKEIKQVTNYVPIEVRKPLPRWLLMFQSLFFIVLAVVLYRYFKGFKWNQ